MRPSAPASTASPALGFTLVEVLVAMTIVAVTLAAGIKAAGSLTTNAERLGEISAAQWCADNELTGLRLAKQTPGIGEADFSCDQLGRSYVGKLVVRPTPNPLFRRVEAQIRNDNDQPVVQLSTVLPTRF